mmetsp:Transcript_19268/g.47989  ORF Transcript_19268/g.47989 Transcript_19268/m.47989 type:complete len:120 (-) Transcript_19268:227-586(-)
MNFSSSRFTWLYCYYSSILSIFSPLLAFKKMRANQLFNIVWLYIEDALPSLERLPILIEDVHPFHSKKCNCHRGMKSSQNATITRLPQCRKSTRRLSRGKDSSTNRTRGFRRLVETSFC